MNEKGTFPAGISLMLLAYLACVGLSSALPSIGGFLPAFFPAAGIAAMAFLMIPKRSWLTAAPLYWITGTIVAVLLGGEPTATSIAHILCVAGSLVAAAVIMQAQRGLGTLESVAGFLSFALAALVSSAAGGAIGATLAAALTGAPWLPTALGWTLSTTSGFLIGSSAIIAARWFNQKRARSLAGPVELLAFFVIWVGLIAANFLFAFLDEPGHHPVYLLMLPLAWLAFRSSFAMNVLAIFILAILGLVGFPTSQGPSPLGGEDRLGRMLSFEVFLSFSALFDFVLFGAFAEIRSASSAFDRERGKYKALLDKALDGIFVTDLEGRFLEINESALSLLGYSRTEVEALRMADLVEAADLPSFMAMMAILKSGRDLELEQSLRKKDGSLLESEVRARSLGEGMIQGVIRDISGRKREEELVRRSIANKEALLRELQHRANNNMQVISALLEFQAMSADDETFTAAIADIQSRLSAMGLVHRMLYETKDLNRINLAAYIDRLAEIVAIRHRRKDFPLRVQLEADEVFVFIDTAIPCGLILLELISNAYKHAYPAEREGKVAITLRLAPDGLISFRVSDRGAGVPPGFDPVRSARLGLVNVLGLAKDQLRGEVAFDLAEGFSCEIRFRDNLHQARV